MSFLFRSSAKGIGRITNRLPLELADDVVGGAVDLLAPEERGGVFLPSRVSFFARPPFERILTCPSEFMTFWLRWQADRQHGACLSPDAG